MEHRDLIVDQFTKQAIPFSTAAGIQDREALALIVEATRAGADDTVLDVACGPGLVVCAFAAVVRHATGIDLTPAMIERGRALAPGKGPGHATRPGGGVPPPPFASASVSVRVRPVPLPPFLQPARVPCE